MKVRTGFVSNSSSSSFVLIVAKGTTEEEIRTKVERIVGEMKGFFMPDFRQQLIDTIVERRGELVDLENDLKWENKWLTDNPDDSTDERDEIQRKIDSGLDYYQGGFSDNGDGPLQAWLCDTSFEVKEDDISMINDGGY